MTLPNKEIAMTDTTHTAGDEARKDVAIVKPAAPRAKPKAPALVPVEKKPFRMSYSGTTDRDYIAHRLNLGAR